MRPRCGFWSWEPHSRVGLPSAVEATTATASESGPQGTAECRRFEKVRLARVRTFAFLLFVPSGLRSLPVEAFVASMANRA